MALVPAELIDTEALREHLGPNGPWAVDSGARVRKYRLRMDKSEAWLAAGVGVTVQTIRMVETGQIVPRDYLRAGIAFCLGQDIETIWPPLTRLRVGELGQVA